MTKYSAVLATPERPEYIVHVSRQLEADMRDFGNLPLSHFKMVLCANVIFSHHNKDMREKCSRMGQGAGG